MAWKAFKIYLNWTRKGQCQTSTRTTSKAASGTFSRWWSRVHNCLCAYIDTICHTSFQALWEFSSSISPWYNRTGWLGVKHQLTYLLPPYLSELLHTYQSFQTLQSSRKTPKSAWNISFHFQAAKIWNSFPTTVHNSQSLLFQEKSFQRMLLSWFVKHLFCTVWLLSGCVHVEEVVLILLIWLLMSCAV